MPSTRSKKKESKPGEEVQEDDRASKPPTEKQEEEKKTTDEAEQVDEDKSAKRNVPTTSSSRNGDAGKPVAAKDEDKTHSPIVISPVNGTDTERIVIIPKPMLLRKTSVRNDKKVEKKEEVKKEEAQQPQQQQQQLEKKDKSPSPPVKDSEMELDKTDGVLLGSDDVVRTWSPATPETAPLHLSSKVSPLPPLHFSALSGEDEEGAEGAEGEGEGREDGAPPMVENTPSYEDKEKKRPRKKTGSAGHGGATARHADPAVVVAPRLLLWDLPATFSHMLFFCRFKTICQLLRVNRRFHALATDDAVWRRLLEGMNLQPLLTAFNVKSNYYRFFLEEVITTRALHGHYTFAAAPPAPDKHKSTAGHTFNGIVRTLSPCSSDDLGDAFLVEAVTLLVSSAELGQMNHPIGRVQLLTKYKNDTMEVLQGSCRFSVYRRCYSLCCNVFANAARGPVFTVTIATATKPWANQSQDHFESHKGGLRLVMTPALLEGQCMGSQISEKDVIAVSKPPAPVQPPFAK